MDLAQIFSRNLRIILTGKGMTFAELADRCAGQLSRSYISGLRRPQHCNPTLQAIAVIAWALHIDPRMLLNPHLKWGGGTGLMPGFIRRECVLSEAQDLQVQHWEEINEGRIRNLEQAANARLEELRH